MHVRRIKAAKPEPDIGEITSEKGAVPTPASPEKKRFSRMPRELTPAELSTKGAQKMLLIHIDRLESENEKLSKFRETLGQTLTQKAVLEQKLDVARSSDLIFGVCLAIGALLIGLAPSIWATKPQSMIVLVGGIIIMVSGIVSRWLIR